MVINMQHRLLRLFHKTGYRSLIATTYTRHAQVNSYSYANGCVQNEMYQKAYCACSTKNFTSVHNYIVLLNT